MSTKNLILVDNKRMIQTWRKSKVSLKEKILNYLISSENIVSGQKMAEIFQVSRGAIWKAIQSLNEEGYKIEGKNNSGYSLNLNLDILSKPLIQKYLNQPFHIEILDEIDSTSTYLKNILDTQNIPCIACAYHQTAGRGRTGKSFFSPDKGLYFSLAFKVNQSIDLTLITIKAGLAVVHALEKITHRECQIKWVNDIYYQHKKVCGILSEAIMDFEIKQISSIIIGIGINLFVKEFPNELLDIATSLGVEKCNKNLIVASIVNEILSNYDSESLINEYKEKCILMNKKVNFKINGQEYRGIAIDINEKGNLIVRTDQDEIMILQSGEVSLGSKYYE